MGKQTPELGFPDSILYSKWLRTSGHPLRVSVECLVPDIPSGHQPGRWAGGLVCPKGKIWFIWGEMMDKEGRKRRTKLISKYIHLLAALNPELFKSQLSSGVVPA